MLQDALESLAQDPPCGRHRKGLGCVDVDARARADAAPAQHRFGEQRRLVGRCGALVREAGDEDCDAPALELLERQAGVAGAIEGVDVVRRFAEAR